MSVLRPELPRELKEHLKSSASDDTIEHNSFDELETLQYPEPQTPAWWPRIIGAGVGMAWYTVAMKRIARSEMRDRLVKLPYGVGTVGVLVEMWFGLDGGMVEECGLRIFVALCIAVSAVVAWACMPGNAKQ
jgi:hypothetical protein